MKKKKLAYWIIAAAGSCAAALFAAQFVLSRVMAQQPIVRHDNTIPTAPVLAPFPAPLSGAMHELTNGSMRPSISAEAKQEREDGQRLADLLIQLRSATDAEKKGELLQEVNELLSAQLDRDLARREESLAEIERRAAELRAQLEARRENKAQTLKILLMLAEHPAAGLGIPHNWMQSLGVGPTATTTLSQPATAVPRY